MKNKYLIIADDFTGSNDTGVQLRRRGYPTKVFFANHFTDTWGEYSIVIDTESRTIPSKAASEIVSSTIANLDFSSFQYVIKKVDSTLRGNIAEELKAIDDIFLPELIIFAPALPDLGRTTINGIQHLNGVRICDTELAQDPKNPVKNDSLVDILSSVYPEPISQISLQQLRENPISFDGARIFCVDAITNLDLQTIIQQANATGKKTLWVGTAGIADNIMNIEEKPLPVLASIASISSTTNTQVKYCESQGCKLVQIPVHDILQKKIEPSLFVSQAIESLNAGYDTLLLPSTSYCREDLQISMEIGEQLGMDLLAIGDYVKTLIGQMTKEILLKTKVSGLFLTGGDTALGVLNNMDAQGSEILSEIAIGIPMLRIVGGSIDGMKVITKAGAFGKEDAITFAIRKLKEA